MLLEVHFNTSTFLCEPLSFVTSLAPRAPHLIVLSDLNILSKRACGWAQDCGNNKECGGLLYGGDDSVIWIGGGFPDEHQAITIPGGFSLVSDRLIFRKHSFWDLLLSFLSLTPQIRRWQCQTLVSLAIAADSEYNFLLLWYQSPGLNAEPPAIADGNCTIFFVGEVSYPRKAQSWVSFTFM